MLKDARNQDHPGIEPPMRLLFEALRIVALKNVKVVILGQDPTPQPGEATGLAFSVKDPRSVGTALNVLLEVALEGFPVNIKKGNLRKWAQQGVLLLNSALTVNRYEAGSHLKANWWDFFTTELVEYSSKNAKASVWLLWGQKAQHFEKFIDRNKHYVITGGHSSALGGIEMNEFFGKGYFQCANKFLIKKRKVQIDWALVASNAVNRAPIIVLDPCPNQPSVGM